jgi:hypothetical protein
VSFRRPADAAGVTPQVRVNGSLSLDGTTTSQQVGLVLGSGGSLVGGAVPGTLAGTGTLSWQGGTLGGALTVGTPLSASSGADMHVLPASQLTLAGVTTLSSTRIALGAAAQLTVSGVAYLTGAPVGVIRGGAGLEGQRLTVAAGAALQRVGGSSPAAAVLDVPVVNRGSVTVSGRLDVPQGYLQEVQKDAESEPVTGLLSPTSSLHAVNASGGYTSVRILGGGLGGVGSVATRKLTLGDAWVHPGFASSAGTLTVLGDLALSPKSDVQLYVRGAEDTKRDVLEVKGLASNGARVAAGRAALAGRISALTGPDYRPSYGTRTRGVIRYVARTGSFGVPVRPITPSGLGWKPSYDDSAKDGDGRGVDIRLMDVQAPTVGTAGVPAFTQRTAQQLTYEAVDNRSGVKSFDVRWRKGTPAKAFTTWRSPRSWRTTKARTQTLRGLDAGWTYCLSIRSRDRLGNVSPWSAPQCVTRMLDDRALAAGKGWSRMSASGLYGGSATRSTRKGATLSTKGTFRRVAVSALRCPSCGTVQVKAGGTVLKTLDLRSQRTGVRTWVSKVRKRARGTVRLTVVSSGRPVAVDSFGLSR